MGHVDGVCVREAWGMHGWKVGNIVIYLFVQHGLHGTCVAVTDSVGIF
jgi:hypothetical protein